MNEDDTENDDEISAFTDAQKVLFKQAMVYVDPITSDRGSFSLSHSTGDKFLRHPR